MKFLAIDVLTKPNTVAPNIRHGKNSRNELHCIIMFSRYRSASSAGGVLGDTSDLLASLICS
jgi:hypothetical protein